MTLGEFLFWAYFVTLSLTALQGVRVFSRISTAFRPMILFIWALLIQSLVIAFLPIDNVVVDLLGAFIDLFLIGWLAKEWQIFQGHPLLAWILMICMVGLFFLEAVLRPTGPVNILWFDVATYFLIALLAIELMNRRLINSRQSLLQDPVFLFSIALLFYNVFSGLLDVFMLIGQYSGPGMVFKAFYFSMILGIFTHIIYLRSFLCIQPKTNYSSN
jgi:hypothetical protein